MSLMQAWVASLAAPASVVPRAYVQGTSSYSGSTSVPSVALAYTGSVTAGNLLVIALGQQSSAVPSTPTDNRGNTYTQVSGGLQTIGGGYYLTVFYAIANASGSLTVTTTLGASSQFVRYVLSEFSGYSGGVDTSAFNSWGSSATGGTVALTTTVANDLLFAWCVDNAAIVSYTAPVAMRQNAGSGNFDATGDNAGSTNTAGSNPITVSAGTATGGMYGLAFKPG